MRMTVPVTIGGNMRWRMRTGINDMNISKNEQISDVPDRLISIITYDAHGKLTRT